MSEKLLDFLVVKMYFSLRPLKLFFICYLITSTTFKSKLSYLITSPSGTVPTVCVR